MKNILSMVALCFALSGCIGGSDEGIPDRRPSGAVSGTAFDGLILNGDVTIYAWNGKKGEVLGAGQTDSKGEYAITLDQVKSQPILIEVTNGRYTEEASGRNVPLRDGDFMYAVKDYNQGDAVSTSLTYYTTIATGLAEDLVRKGMAPTKAITQANDEISNLIGINIREVTPLEIVDASNAAPAVTAAHLYGFATASISGLTQFISEQNNSPDHEEYNSIRFAAAAYSDIAADGVLDGQGPDGALVSQGIVELTTKMYRYQVATNMLVMANSDVNKTTITAEDVLPMARMYNKSVSAIFGDADVIPMSMEVPFFTNLSFENNDVIAGTITFSASVIDPVGLDEVSLYIDDTLQEYKSGNDSPVFALDTRALSDGYHVFKLYAKNIVGGEASKTIGLQVSNAGTTISNIRPEDGSIVTGVQTFTGKITDPVGISAVDFILDGAVYPMTANETPSKIFDLTGMVEGPHTFSIKATNTVSNATTESSNFTIDNTKPTVSWNLAGVDVMSGTSETINATVNDNTQVAEAGLYINGALLNKYTIFPINEEINTLGYPEGKKTFVLEAKDVAGNVSTIQRNVIFDSTPPSVNITNPVSGEAYTKPFTLSADIYEAVGIKNVEVMINGSHLRWLAPADNGRVSTTIDPGDYSNSAYTIKVIATDDAGYVGQSGTFVKLAGQPPVFEASSNRSGTKDVSVRVEFFVSNNDSGPYTVKKVWVDGSLEQDFFLVGESSYSGNFGPFTNSCSYEGASPVGGTEYKLQVADTFGNLSNVVTYNAPSCNPFY